MMMKAIELHNIVAASTEQDIHHKINRDEFFMILEKADVDLKQLASKRKKNDYQPYHRFNFILKELHEQKKINITEACIYLETEMLPVKDIIACLNEENLYSLRTSLAERNNIKLKKNSLDVFLYN